MTYFIWSITLVVLTALLYLVYSELVTEALDKRKSYLKVCGVTSSIVRNSKLTLCKRYRVIVHCDGTKVAVWKPTRMHVYFYLARYLW